MQNRHGHRLPPQLLEHQPGGAVGVDADQPGQACDHLQRLAKGLELELERDPRSCVQSDLAHDRRALHQFAKALHVKRLLCRPLAGMAAHTPGDQGLRPGGDEGRLGQGQAHGQDRARVCPSPVVRAGFKWSCASRDGSVSMEGSMA